MHWLENFPSSRISETYMKKNSKIIFRSGEIQV